MQRWNHIWRTAKQVTHSVSFCLILYIAAIIKRLLTSIVAAHNFSHVISVSNSLWNNSFRLEIRSSRCESSDSSPCTHEQKLVNRFTKHFSTYTAISIITSSDYLRWSLRLNENLSFALSVIISVNNFWIMATISSLWIYENVVDRSSRPLMISTSITFKTLPNITKRSPCPSNIFSKKRRVARKN